MKPHKHAELIKAWADGAEIEFYDTRFEEHRWKLCRGAPLWSEDMEYRIQPEEPSDTKFETYISWDKGWQEVQTASFVPPNLRLIFDGKTCKLKSVEMIK